jgi:hypothetical protein
MATPATTDLIRFYDDGPNHPDTPLRAGAERAYRDAFLDAANEVIRLQECFEYIPLEDAWEERRQVRDDAEIEQDQFRANHIVAAARARGRVQAFEFVAQARERGQDRCYSDQRIAAEVIVPWGQRVAAWAAQEIDPKKISLPPRPDDDWPEEPKEKSVAPRSEPVTRRVCEVPRAGNLAFLRNGTKPVFAPVQQAEPSDAPEFPMQTLRELVMRYPHLRPPVVHGLLREGETLNVIASPKVGKSWLVSDLALAVATGRPWLDIFPCEQGRVLVIDNELHKETSAHRIPKVMEARGITLADCGDRIAVANLRGELKDIFGLGQCFARIEPGQFKLVVIDAFYRAMPKDTDENDNGTMAQVYNVLDSYAARLQCSFVLIHHSTKGNQSGKAITDVGAGAGAQSRAADTHLVLRPHEQTDVVVLDAAVRSWPPIQPRCLRWTFPVWTLDDALDPADLRSEKPRRKPKPAAVEPAKPAWDAARFASAFVTAEPAVTLAVIARAIKAGVLEGQAKKLLKLAEADGLVHRWKFGASQPVQFANRPQPEERP